MRGLRQQQQQSSQKVAASPTKRSSTMVHQELGSPLKMDKAKSLMVEDPNGVSPNFSAMKKQLTVLEEEEI